MKRRMLSILLCTSVIGTSLTGCEKTPEEAIVREKGADSVKEYESVEDTDVKGSLREMLGAPEHYKNEESYENGGLVIDTDADVYVPEVDTVNTYAVSAMEVNQDMIDTVTKAFFEGDKVYQGISYYEQTKEDYQKKITLLKKYKAEGNYDPYDHGVGEDGELQYDIDEQIERNEERMKDAPDSVEKEEVVPALNLEFWNGKGEERIRDIDQDHFTGVVETAEGNYDYTISYLMKPDVDFTISKCRDDFDPEEFSAWTEGEYILDYEGDNHISEEAIQSKLNISYEDAKALAEEKIERLGWGWQVCGWNYSVFTHGEGGAREDNMLDAGYLFYFARELDGIPVTHTASYGGALEDMDSTLVPWSYERCEVIVGDDGIQNVKILNPYEIGAVSSENVRLMDFDSIMQIYEQMMEVTNADITKYEAKRTYHIRKITLGYTRIYDPTKDSETGLLVPVWDFFGGFDVEDMEGSSSRKDSGEHSTRSYITINAIDGTLIDRGLGY